MIRITSNEKAFMAGVMAFLATTVVQLQQSGQFTLRQFEWSIGSWVLAHLTVWWTTNTPKAPTATPPAATV